MLISPIKYNNNFNVMTQRNVLRTSYVSFCGGKQQLVQIKPEDFSTEAATKMFRQISKIFEFLKDGGNINDVRILSEELKFVNRKTGEDFKSKIDILMSIKKDSNKALLTLHRMYPNKRKHCVLEAQLDKYGQMTNGQYHLGHLNFERKNNNLRRMELNDCTIFPDGKNDREWGITANILPPGQEYGDNSSVGMLEIFLELARLHTTMYG